MGEARRKRDRERQVALTAYSVSAFEEPAKGQKRSAPTEFRLFRYGTNETQKGDFVFDERSAESVMAMYAKQGVPYMGDYEHQSLAQPPIKAPASITEFKPEIRMDEDKHPELWATRVKWADDAKREVEAGQYRLYSPAFATDPDADGKPTNHISYLINVALTNLPASHGLTPLVAASAVTPQGDTMDNEEKLKELAAKLAQAEKERDEAQALCGTVKATVEKKLGKSFDDWAAEESEEHEETKALKTEKEEEGDLRKKAMRPGEPDDGKELRALRAHVIATTGKASLTEAMGAISLAVAQAKEFVALKAKMERDAADAAEEEFSGLIESSVKEGKLPPVMKESFVSLKRELGTAKALVALKTFVPKEPIVSLRAEREPDPVSAVDPMALIIARACAGQFGGEAAFKSALTKAQ